MINLSLTASLSYHGVALNKVYEVLVYQAVSVKLLFMFADQCLNVNKSLKPKKSVHHTKQLCFFRKFALNSSIHMDL